jgi:hypothetical protein
MVAGGEVTTSQKGDYLISQDKRPVDEAQTYEEATTKAKAIKRLHPESRVEIQYSGITVEID